MAFDPARPRYTLPFAGTDYDLLGTMELIEAVEYALGRGILQVSVDVIEAMPTWELSRLLSAILSCNDTKMSPQEVKTALWGTVGISGDANKFLRVHLYNFLAICLAPPEQREAKAKRAGELLGKLVTASPGATTSPSASAS